MKVFARFSKISLRAGLVTVGVVATVFCTMLVGAYALYEFRSRKVYSSSEMEKNPEKQFLVLESSALPEPGTAPYPDCFMVFKVRNMADEREMLLALKGFEGRSLMEASVFQRDDLIYVEELKEDIEDGGTRNVVNDILNQDPSAIDLPLYYGQRSALVERGPERSIEEVEKECFAGRLPSLNLIRKRKRAAMLERFLDHKIAAANGNAIQVMLGDSQMDGAPRPFEETYCGLLKEDGYDFVNLAFASASPRDYEWLLETIERKGVGVDWLVYELNLRAYNDRPDKNQVADSVLPLRVNNEDVRRYWAIYSSLVFSGEDGRFKDLEQRRGSDIFVASGINRATLRSVCQKMKQVSDRHLIFFAPYCRDIIEQSSLMGDYKSIYQMHREILEDEEMNVADFALELDVDCFVDILHLSERGHRQVRQHLQAALNDFSSDSE